MRASALYQTGRTYNMRAFIIRPFGVKADCNGNPIHFDSVERDLVDPVLKELAK